MLKALLFFSLIAAGCGGDDDDTGADAAAAGGADAAVVQPDASPPDASSAVPGNTVGGRASYAGSATGDLVVALYASLPPAGPPLEFTRLTGVTFPAEFELTDVDAGTYQLVLVLDVGGDDPILPGDEDLQASSDPFDVTDEVGAWLDVEIEDE